jgi:hypothetical protein
MFKIDGRCFTDESQRDQSTTQERDLPSIVIVAVDVQDLLAFDAEDPITN